MQSRWVTDVAVDLWCCVMSRILGVLLHQAV